VPELFIDGARHRIAYRRAGRRRPLVLLHPLALSGEAWGGYAGRLASSFEVITLDARGHGNSGGDGRPFGLTDLGDDVAALLDGLGIASAFVTGMSMGGSTAVNFAGRYPSRVDGLVLADTTAWYGDNAAATRAARAEGVVATPREQQVTFSGRPLVHRGVQAAESRRGQPGHRHLPAHGQPRPRGGLPRARDHGLP